MGKVVFNATGNVVGGGVRNSALFISNALKSVKIQWLFLVSVEVKLILDSMGLTDERISLFEKSPAKNNVYRNKLLAFVSKEKPDLVFTMAGPIYTRLTATHVMGISNAYITHPSWEAFFLKKGIINKLKKILNSAVKSYYAKQADYFFFQTEYSKNQFCMRFNVAEEKVRVVHNAFDESVGSEIKITPFNANKIEILCPSAPYEHKGLQYIPAISSELEKLLPDKNIIFKLTIDKDANYYAVINHAIKRHGQENKVVSIGKYNYNQTTELFNNCDFVFMPSLLETFSATYLEAMLFRKPLIVSDRNFARDICGNSALYVEPKKPKQSALQIADLIKMPELRSKLIQNGSKHIHSYPNQENRYQQIEKILLEIIDKP